jgi:hypothetical protein
MPPHMNGHILINYRQVALDRFQDAARDGMPPNVQLGLLAASSTAAMIDCMNTLRDIRDLLKLSSE